MSIPLDRLYKEKAALIQKGIQLDIKHQKIRNIQYF